MISIRPEQAKACSGFLLLFFNRLAVLVEQLTCTFRRLAGDVLHRNALPLVGLVVRRGEVGGDLQISRQTYGELRHTRIRPVPHWNLQT